MSSVAGMDYVVIAEGEVEVWEPVVAGLLVRDTIEVVRKNKKKKRRRGPQERTVDIRANIESIELEPMGEGQTLMRITLQTIEGRGAKIREVLETMDADFSGAIVVRVNTRFTEDLPLGWMAEGKGEHVKAALAAQTPQARP
jgi:hypothetical protein